VFIRDPAGLRSNKGEVTANATTAARYRSTTVRNLNVPGEYESLILGASGGFRIELWLAAGD
jgi:hypothetical protein